MRVVFAGTPEVALPALDAIAASAHELVGVVTRPDAPAGRGRKLVASPVAQRAEELGVPVLKPDHPRDPDFQQALRDLAPDCCPVVAYGALLPQSALDIPEHGWVNLHFSVPARLARRGPGPARALGRRRGHRGDHVPDRQGSSTPDPTFGVMTERIRPTDTAGDLLGRLAEGGAGLLVATSTTSTTAPSRPARSRPRASRFAPKITVEDARVDWTEPAVAVDRRIRACTPGPGAWTTFAGERIKLGPVTLTDTAAPARGPRGRQERRPRRHRHRGRAAR